MIIKSFVCGWMMRLFDLFGMKVKSLPFVDDILLIVILVVTNVVTFHPIESDPSTSPDNDPLSHAFPDPLVLPAPPWFSSIVKRFCVHHLVNVSIVRHGGSCPRLAPYEHGPRVVMVMVEM